MIDHMGVHTADIEKARRFYDAALEPLGVSTVMEVTPAQTGGYHGVGYGTGEKPFFWLSSESGRAVPDGMRGMGVHVAFEAGSRAAVDAFYAAAMKHGGRDNGPPGVRPHYHPAYYAAFVFDPDGINVEAVCHKPE
ncbi:MAG: glyoxalase/bleomycin resistance/extradiol dioxygenase family protein [Ancylobacter novellus]|uniref:Glyoxalase/bleomycin resistance/extradiol dioxygenase family protein n=1 Tax=Ancylobacter novellus TaxID=921 RepID=A0A2W5KTR3_ANCNO|nr:MAG: glyoxalase/bleomycin resistance/extradiol dioxygenase family protein [Ancylobacter novellus]